MLCFKHFVVLIISALPVAGDIGDAEIVVPASAYCDDGILYTFEVDELLSVINYKRTLLASGLQLNGGLQFGTVTEKLLPPAENMRNMTYDCNLEQEAKSLLAKVCPGNGMDSEEPDKGYLLGKISFEFSSGVWNTLSSIDTFGFSSFDMDQAVKFTDNDKNNLTTYANLMRADASKIGCFANYRSPCTVTQAIGDVYPGRYHPVLFCVTDQKNIQNGEEIYKVATPKTECNPLISDVGPSVSTEAQFPGPEDGESTMCEWGGIPDTLREQILETHNSRRETLALGGITDNTGTALPSATDMNCLVWNCTLEKEAHDFLKSCPTEGYQRPDDNSPAQNFYRGNITANETYRDMHKKTVTEWWKKGRKVDGPGKTLYFLSEHNNTEIRSFTLMGWGSTSQIGCSIAKCDNQWVEACRYYPPGNKPGAQMYTPGRACSQCDRLGKSCYKATGLCK